jgi:putative FmdB family regulatory protein
MPIYEYRCKNCGYQFEQLQEINAKPLQMCPKCDKPHLAKLISSTNFQLKGTGWYVTDFKDKPQKEKASAEVSNGAEKRNASATSSTETKKSEKDSGKKDITKNASDKNVKNKKEDRA